MAHHRPVMSNCSGPPPPERLVAALVSAGLSRATAMDMEPTKAEEVLLLLGPWGVRTVRRHGRLAPEGTRPPGAR